MSKISIMSGNFNVNRKELEGIFDKFVIDEYKDSDSGIFMRWPEVEDGLPLHEAHVYNSVLKTAKWCIDNNRDMAVLTYSVHAFNAMRVAAYIKGYDQIECHQIKSDKADFSTLICVNGTVTYEDGVFDTWDNAIDLLLGLDEYKNNDDKQEEQDR